MFAKQSKFSLFILLLGWVISQGLVLHHEYSEEHIQQTENHFCLAQISNNDDMVAHDTDSFVILSSKNHSLFNFKTVDTFAYRITINARAPPIRIS